ncbi:MAG: hypothetical protein GQ570_01100 [Helicobacteraceae bacterium]|nr:hypothetical protein [Helicobacteraceae bacterium]
MSTTLEELIKNENIQELIELCEDKEIDIEQLKTIYFSYKDNREIVGQIAMNLSLRTSVYDRSQAYSDTMVELLSDIATNPVDMGARWAVAKNPHTPVEVLLILADDKVNLVRALVATNPSTPTKVLEKFFNDEKIVRDGLSGNPSTPEKLLKILSSDADKMVRMRLCDNPGATSSLLKSMLNDEESEVAKAAEINLERVTNEKK